MGGLITTGGAGGYCSLPRAKRGARLLRIEVHPTSAFPLPITRCGARELSHVLKAWEAMRLGKDAQIAALMERWVAV